MYKVYGIRCKETGRIYIGCTRRPLEERFKDHFGQLKRGEKDVFTWNEKNERVRVPTKWQQDYNKYGKGGFEFYQIEDNIPDDQRLIREAYWIHHYKSNEEQYGYNFRVKDNRPQFEIKVQIPPTAFEK